MSTGLDLRSVRSFIFFFQAEDGIRDLIVTGVQTCALPIFIGDVAHLCVQLTEFDWSPLGDVDREISPGSRHKVVEEAIGRNALLAGPHLEEGPVFGRMVMLNGR